MEKLKKDRNDKTLRLRQINDECSAIQSKINKDLETLIVQYEYKEFLDNLKHTPEERAAMRAERLKFKQNKHKKGAADLLRGAVNRRGTNIKGNNAKGDKDEGANN